MKIAIGSDHAGYDYKELIKAQLAEQHEITDFGTHSRDSVDYPDFVHPTANAIEEESADLGILICGSANGVAITANKHPKVRAAICWQRDLAQLARQHNNANMICIPARFVAFELAMQMIEDFLSTEFEGGRHQRRVEKITIQ